MLNRLHKYSCLLRTKPPMRETDRERDRERERKRESSSKINGAAQHFSKKKKSKTAGWISTVCKEAK